MIIHKFSTYVAKSALSKLFVCLFVCLELSLSHGREYLKRINLYRQRVWTCKVTCKTNLTYEEALVSEQRATEKIQHFPEELMAPVLHLVQYSKNLHIEGALCYFNNLVCVTGAFQLVDRHTQFERSCEHDIR